MDGHTGREQKATLSPALIVLRAVHHWHVIDRVSLQAITGYSQATVRWATEKLMASKQIEDIGYAKGVCGYRNEFEIPGPVSPWTEAAVAPLFSSGKNWLYPPAREAGTRVA